MVSFIKSFKKSLIFICLAIAFVLFSVSYIGFATLYTNSGATFNATLAIVYYVVITAAYILIAIGVATKKRFLVTIPLIALAAFVGSLFVNRFADATAKDKYAPFNAIFFAIAALIDLGLLAVAILYIVGYLAKHRGCQRAIDIILYIGLVLIIAQIVMACFFQPLYGYGWEFITLYCGFFFFYFLMIIFLNTNLITDEYIVGVLYSAPEKIENEEDEVK